MNNHSRIASTGLRPRVVVVFSLAMAALLMLVSGVAGSSEIRLRKAAPQNRAHRDGGPDEGDARSAKSFIWLEGVLRLDSRGQLSLDGTPVDMTRATGVYPIPEGGVATAEDVANQYVSVAGEVTRAGLRATLILVRGRPSLADSIKPLVEDPDIVPSEADPSVGVYRPASPN